MNKLNNNRWICFKTNFREEFLAKNNLTALGFNVLMPYYLKTIRHARRQIQVKYPLFPLYGFLQYDGNTSSLYNIKYSKGVKYYLQNSDGFPKLLPNNIIKEIQILRKTDGSFSFNPNRFKVGDEVNIVEGVFTGLKAIFTEQVDEWRSRLLVNFIGRINDVEINSQMIEKV